MLEHEVAVLQYITCKCNFNLLDVTFSDITFSKMALTGERFIDMTVRVITTVYRTSALIYTFQSFHLYSSLFKRGQHA